MILVLILGFFIYKKEKISLESLKELLNAEITKRINAPSRKELLFRSLMEEFKNDIQASLQCSHNSVLQKIETGQKGILLQKNADMKEIVSRISDLTCTVKELQSTLQNLQASIEYLGTSREDTNLSDKVVRADFQEQVYPYVLYAQMLDSDSPKGFLVSELKKVEKGCVFKLTIQSRDTGIFEFVDDETIHLEILSAFNPIVTETSDYENINSSQSRIIVMEPGVLRLENNVWEIMNKQKVKIE